MPGYEVHGATRQHTTPPWTWDPQRKFWILDDSDSDNGARPDKGYTCVQYAMAKLTGTAPDLTDQTQRDRVAERTEEYLAAAGYTKRANCQQCGCQDGGLTNCAVVFKKRSGEVFHVAVFDSEFCDWGGKLSGRGPIARFADPMDYVRTFDAESQADTVFECWCKDSAQTTTIRDEDLNARARGPARRPGCLFVLLFVGTMCALIAMLATG